MEACRGGVFEDLFELESLRIVRIIEVLQALPDRSALLIKSIGP